MASSAPRRGSIEIGDDPVLERRFWMIERAGWVAMGVLLLLALLGVFGEEGVLSSATARSADGTMTVEYRRFLHYQSHSDVTWRLPVPPGDGGVELWISEEYAHALPAELFLPRPTEERTASGRVIYRFEAEPGQRRMVVAADVNPHGMGLIPAEAGIVGGPSISFFQFVYP